MVTGTIGYVLSGHIPYAPESKFSGEATNKFEINVISLEQAYYWTKEWQEGEKEADRDIEQGRVKDFGSAKDTIKHLRSRKK